MDKIIPHQPHNPLNDPRHNPKLDKAKDSATKSLAIFGLICILGILSVGMIKVAPEIIRDIASAAVTMSSVFVPAQSLSVSTSSSSAASGQPFTISWVAPAGEEGSYMISYPCTDLFHLEAVGMNNGSNTIIFCNTAFQFLNNNNSITVAGYIQQGNTNTLVNVPITVYFIKNGSSGSSASGKVSVAITSNGSSNISSNSNSNSGIYTGNSTSQNRAPAVISTTPSLSTKAPTAQTVGQPTTSTYTVSNSGSNSGSSGLTTGGTYTPGTSADLAVHILATGIIDPTSGAFVSKDEIPQSGLNGGDKAAIQFEIVNQGGRATGPWSFAVVLPTYPAYTFQSNSQQSLNPGDKIQYTISFDQIKQQASGDTFIINADNTNQVNETNKANNIVSGVMYINTNQ